MRRGDSLVDAVIQRHGSIDAAYVEFPYDVEQEFGTRGQVKVAATFDGHEYRGSLVRMGTPRHCLGITQAVRRAIGKGPGQIVHVVLARDTQPRVLEVSPDLAEALSRNQAAAERWEKLSYTHRKEYARWITEAKRAETRKRRVRETVRRLAGEGE